MKYFRCNCSCGGIEVEIFPEDWNICISFLKRVGWRRGLGERFRMIWQLLTRGYYYDTDIILTKSTAGALGSTLVEMSYNLEER